VKFEDILWLAKHCVKCEKEPRFFNAYNHAKKSDRVLIDLLYRKLHSEWVLNNFYLYTRAELKLYSRRYGNFKVINLEDGSVEVQPVYIPY